MSRGVVMVIVTDKGLQKLRTAQERCQKKTTIDAWIDMAEGFGRGQYYAALRKDRVSEKNSFKFSFSVFSSSALGIDKELGIQIPHGHT